MFRSKPTHFSSSTTTALQDREMDETTTTQQRNFFIQTMVKNDFGATQIHEWLCKAWGEDCIGLPRAQCLCREFRAGERCSASRTEGSGRPKSSCTDANAAVVKNLVEGDKHLSCAAIEELTDIAKSSVHRILTNDLKKQSLCARWVPHQLTPLNMELRTGEARNIKKALRTRRISRRFAVVDEKSSTSPSNVSHASMG